MKTNSLSVVDSMFEALRAKTEQEALPSLRAALGGGADPNAKRKPEDHWIERHALDTATRSTHPWAPKMVEMLLDAGAAPVFGDDGRSALHTACRHGRVETVELLLSRGLDARLATRDGWTPFLCAAANGNFALCERLAPLSKIKAHADDGCATMRVDAAGLFIALNDPASALEAYRRGWGNPALVGNSHWTPLIKAINKQPKPHQDEEDGQEQATPEEWAALIDFLGKHPRVVGAKIHSNRSVLGHAIACEDRRGARMLIEAGHPLNCFDDRGFTPLALALFHGETDLAKTLLDAGADPALRKTKGNKQEGDWSGVDALMAAIVSADPEAVALLAPQMDRFDRNAKLCDNGLGALHMAVRCEDQALTKAWIEKLLNAGWDPNHVHAKGQPPLMSAIAAKNYAAMALLLPVSDLSIKSANGLNALEGAQWLANERGEAGPLGMIQAYLEGAKLRECVEAGPNQRAKQAARAL